MEGGLRRGRPAVPQDAPYMPLRDLDLPSFSLDLPSFYLGFDPVGVGKIFVERKVRKGGKEGEMGKANGKQQKTMQNAEPAFAPAPPRLRRASAVVPERRDYGGQVGGRSYCYFSLHALR